MKRSKNTLGIMALLGLLQYALPTWITTADSSLLVQSCQSDSIRTLADLEREGSKQGYAFNVKQVPKGLEIDQRPQRYTVIRDGASAHNLPTEDFPGSMRFRLFYKDIAACKVRAPDGVWWFATRTSDGYLFFISNIDATTD